MPSESEIRPNQTNKQFTSIGQVIHSAASSKSGTTAQLLTRLLEALRLHLGMEVGFISRIADGQREFLYVSSERWEEAPTPGVSDPVEETACIKVVRNEVPNLVRNAQTQPSLKDLSTVINLGIRSHASVPIPSGNHEHFGTLCCYSCENKESLDERDIGFMYAIADVIGTTLQEEQRTFDDISRRRNYISDSLKAGVLQMVWQPIMNTFTGNVVAVESLARFQTDPYRPPNEWFEEAVALGVGSELEKSAFAKGMAIKDLLPPDIYVGCNLSGATFLEPDFQDFLKQQNLDQVVLEITEHDIIADYTELANSLSDFRNFGLKLAVDDFGAGYASFRHIVELNPDSIKLDMSLVRNIDRCPAIQSAVRALVGFAEDRGSNLLAEGVETRAELDMLKSLGIQRAQGYFFHKPMPQEQLLELFTSN